MVYALEMFLDEQTEQKIMNYFQKIKDLGISSYLIDVDSRPHITIGCFHDIHVERANEILKQYCSMLAQFTLTFPSIGVFTFPSPCVFLAPVVTSKLLELHKDLHRVFNFCSSQGFEYYLPDSWVPHCAVDISTDISSICKSTEFLLNEFRAFEGKVTNMAWVEITKPVKRLERMCLI